MTPTLPDALACDHLTWMPTEASGRRFARLLRPRRFGVDTAVVMVFARGTRAAEVERVDHATRLLAAAGLPVPEIYATEPEQRWILQEDLGDETLAKARERGAQIAEAYSEAVALLQRIAGLHLPTSPRPPLDRQRLLDELRHFAVVALHLPEGPGAGLQAEFEQLVEPILAQPTVLCHRDYHARNLLLKDGRVRVVDHQDALPGPAAYDRASLAYDPYVDLPEAIRDRIAGDLPGTGAVAVQRLAKAMGTYAEKGARWRAHITPAARQARRLVDRDGLPLPLLKLAFATLAAGASVAPDDEAVAS
jgi:aminoglycoside/choline kinase family phosphotransferase